MRLSFLDLADFSPPSRLWFVTSLDEHLAWCDTFGVSLARQFRCDVDSTARLHAGPCDPTDWQIGPHAVFQLVPIRHPDPQKTAARQNVLRQQEILYRAADSEEKQAPAADRTSIKLCHMLLSANKVDYIRLSLT